MERTYEEIRSEVLHLDVASQQRLADEIEQHLSEILIDEEGFSQARITMEAHLRGEGKSMSMEESLVRGRQLIEDAKRARQ